MKTNNRFSEMDDYLKYWRDIILENDPSLYKELLHNSTIYNDFVVQGVPKDTKDDIVKQHFSDWCKYYKENDKINVFHSLNWSYFCQFESTNSARNKKDYIKVYIPLDEKHIRDGALQIFNFLTENNISHISKIGSDIRFDDIVVRLCNIEDAKKFKQFIYDNEYIQEGLIKPNPFSYSENNISIVSDGYISYNYTIASYISLYLQKCVENNMVNNIGINDFYNFLKKYYYDTFITKKNLRNLACDLDIEYGADVDIIDYKGVTELFLNSFNKNFSFIDYIEHFQRQNDMEYRRNYNRECSDYLYHKNNQKSTCFDDLNINISKIELYQLNDLLINAYETMSEKYNPINQIIGYLETGEDYYLTRTNKVRARITQTNFRNDLSEILKNNSIKLQEYINLVYQEKEKEKYEFINYALVETYKKYSQNDYDYGIAVAAHGLYQLIQEDKCDGFTRDNSARYNLIKNNIDSIVASKYLCNQLGIKEQNLKNIPNASLVNLCKMYVADYINNDLSISPKTGAI